MKKIAVIVLTSIISATLTIIIYKQFEGEPRVIIKETIASPAYMRNTESEFVRTISTPSSNIMPDNFTFGAIKAMPAVVYIKSVVSNRNKWGQDNESAASGSGVIISSDGFIVTSNHVVANSSSINITTHDNFEYEAEIIGNDKNTDLALLKIDANKLPFLIFGDSDSLQIGEWVMAVGNPFGLQSTVTAGIVSAKGRNINIFRDNYGIESFIQTDAAVNPGNSGGALINVKGELVGINTAIMTMSGRYEGYSFAVPSKISRKIVEDLKEFGLVQRGLLGIRISNLDHRLANSLSLDGVSKLSEFLKIPSNNGIYVVRVLKGGGAEVAGLKMGDVITAVNGQKTNGISELHESLISFRPGVEVDVTVFRNGKEQTNKVVLRNEDNSTDLLSVRTDKELLDLGLEVRDLSDHEIGKLKTKGVRVVSVIKGSLIDETNMVPDYIITHINGSPILNSTDLISKLNDSRGVVELDGFYEYTEAKHSYRFLK